MWDDGSAFVRCMAALKIEEPFLAMLKAKVRFNHEGLSHDAQVKHCQSAFSVMKRCRDASPDHE